MYQREMTGHYILTILVTITQVTSSCFAQPPANSDGDTAAENSTVSELFLARDVDKNGSLTEEELVKGGGQDEAALKRDFKVFDANTDGLLSEAEFLSIPALTPEQKRSAIPDPVVLLSAATYSELESRWSESDQDADGSLNQDEFDTAKISQNVRGLESLGFNDWDLDEDTKVSKDEIAKILDIAFGVRSPTGELLRSRTGQVVYWPWFLVLNPDEQGKVSRDSYIKWVESMSLDPDALFPTIHAAGNEKFGVTEYMTSVHKTDPIGLFLNLDADLSGLLSPAELDAFPAGHGPPGKNWLSGFDDDHDGAYSLREFRFIPQANFLAIWHSARDTDSDGKLSSQEFHFMPTPALAALSKEYFRRLDTDSDGFLTLTEWKFETSHPDARFTSLDKNSDDELSEAEFNTEGSLPIDRLGRDFKVFDADSNGKMTKSEFFSIPHWVAENQRTVIPDPVALLSESRLSELTKNWTDWDKDNDGLLNSDDFQAAGITRKISGLEMTGFSDWDLDKDTKVSKDEVAKILDIAFGVRSPTGELLRSRTGQVVHWPWFLSMNPDEHGKVSRDSYIKWVESISLDPVALFPTIHAAGNEKFGVTEYMTSVHKTDPIGLFLNLDADLSGLLSPAELDAFPAGHGPPGKNWLSGFDDDHDGAYSLREFRFIPQVNFLAIWHNARDTDSDGKLSSQEFHFMPTPALAALSKEYFRRLDTDSDGFLTLTEWKFETSHPDARFTSLDKNSDDELSEAEFNTEGSLPIDRLGRDFKVFDADSNGKMTKSEFFSIPHWVAENQRTVIPDPVALLSESRLSELTKNWTDLDKDGDGLLDSDEFKTAGIPRKISGLEMTGFSDWDLDKDTKVSKDEVAKILDIAFGVRSPTGELLHSRTGQIVHWTSFLAMNPDEHGKASREAYIRMIGSLSSKPEEMFPAIYSAGNERFGVTEYMTSVHKTDPIGLFLNLDADLSGLLSPAELDGLPAWSGPPEKHWLSGFDDDRDGAYSLREFRFIPQVNFLATWHSAGDTDSDGKLSSQEFHFMPTPALAALSKEYFRRLDTDSDGFLTLTEWKFETSHPDARFTSLDKNSDDELSEAEFNTEGSLPIDRLGRDFKVFDADSNGKMTKSEFFSIPHWVAENQRTVIPDPVALLSESRLSELTKNWTDWDKDNDGLLNSDDFQAAGITRKISGLEMTGFSDWDLDKDTKVSKDEVAKILDIAFGVRSPTGELLRSRTGHVVHWPWFLVLNPDEQGKVSRDSYIKWVESISSKPEELFPTIHAAGNEKFGVTEYMTSVHKTDPIGLFLNLDADLSGLLSPAELDAFPAGHGPPGKNWLSGFDDDHDGAYSLREFRFIPQANFLAIWHSARDTDSDGKLSSQEFHFMPTPAIAALSKEYFRRLDVDNDGFLTLKEWSFSFDFARVPRDVIIELRDRNGDHVLNFEEVLGEMRRPEPGDKVDVNQEAGLARMEEAFSRADVNADGQLDRQELSSDDGLEAISPGSSGVARKVNFNSMAPVSKLAGLEDASLETYLIIEVNVLLVVGVAIYLFRKRDRKK